MAWQRGTFVGHFGNVLHLIYMSGFMKKRMFSREATCGGYGGFVTCDESKKEICIRQVGKTFILYF